MTGNKKQFETICSNKALFKVARKYILSQQQSTLEGISSLKRSFYALADFMKSISPLVDASCDVTGFSCCSSG